jgi:hypothetical protein
VRKLKSGVWFFALGLLAAVIFGFASYVWPALPVTVRAPIAYRLQHKQFPWDGCFAAYINARAATGTARPLGPADGAKVAEACRALAERGDGPAATLMAEAEIGRLSNSEEAAKAAFGWLEKGAAAGYGPAYLRLGIYHMVGRGTPKDAVKANAAVIAAAKTGDAMAQFMAARAYEQSIGTAQDYEQSLGWYTVLLRSSARIREAGTSQRELELTVAQIKKHLTPAQIAKAEAFADAYDEGPFSP